MEKPLHVRVAEALGWTAIVFERDQAWGTEPGQEEYPNSWIPRYDTDWSATGPMIERFNVTLGRHGIHGPEGWIATAWVRTHDNLVTGFGESPLIATCNVLLALKEAGKL